jgi:hypothetical protein
MNSDEYLSHQEFEDLDAFTRHVLTAFPEAEIDEDNDGQLVVYTNLFFDQASLAVRSMELIGVEIED